MQALIIDPSATYATLHAQILFDLGFNVDLAEDMGLALDRLSAGPTPDLVLLSGSLPQSLVESLMRSMRQQVRLRYVRVISVLGAQDLAHLDWNLNDPLHACLLRPLAPAELCARMLQLGVPVQPRHPEEGQQLYWHRDLALA